MPSFEQNILSSPIGFSSGCLSLNSLSSDFDIFIRHIGKILLTQKQGQISSTTSSISNQTIEFIGRQYFSSTPKPSLEEIQKVLTLCTVLNEEAIQGFVTVFDRLTNVNVELKPRSHVTSLFLHILYLFFFL